MALLSRAFNYAFVQRRIPVKLTPFHAIALAEPTDDVLYPVGIVAAAVSRDIENDVLRIGIG